MERTRKTQGIKKGMSLKLSRDEAIKIAAVQLADIIIQYHLWKRRMGPTRTGTMIQSGAQIESRDKVQAGD